MIHELIKSQDDISQVDSSLNVSFHLKERPIRIPAEYLQSLGSAVSHRLMIVGRIDLLSSLCLDF